MKHYFVKAKAQHGVFKEIVFLAYFEVHLLPQNFISNQILYRPIAVGYMSLFGILGYSVMAQTVCVSYEVSWKPPSGNTDPVVTVSCMAHDLPSGYAALTYQWEHNDTVLSRNDALLVDADRSRFSVGDDGKELLIRNAVIVDEGSYTCSVFYRLSSILKHLSNIVFVSITTYLPPLNYPQCSVSPDTGITVGSEINLICDSGISLSSLSMTMVTLLIHRPDGTVPVPSSGRVTWTVREEDDMAQFMCTMESSTFPTALRTCSAIFNATTTPPTPKIRISSIPDESHTTSTSIQGTKEYDFITSEEMIKAYTSTAPTGSGSGWSGPKEQSGAVVAGAVIGGLLVLLVIVGIIVVVIIFIRRKSEEKPPSSPPSNGTRDTEDLRVDFSKAGNVYSKETIYNNDALLSDRPSTSNGHPPNQPRPVSVVYGVVDKTKSNGTSGAVRSTNSTPTNPKNTGDSVYECADLDKRPPPIKPAAADAAVGAELPVYGKVNKGYKTDRKDDGQKKRESSGFVDNIIYEPSQI